MTQSRFQRIHSDQLGGSGGIGGDRLPEKARTGSRGPQMQALPVQTVTVTMAPVAQSSEYVATIKSRRSATVLPQVSGH